MTTNPPPGWWPAPPPLPKAGDARTEPLPLHPMAVSDILDGAFKLLKANVRTLATVVGVLVIPFQVVGALAQRNLLGGRSVLSIASDPSVLAAARSTGNSVRLQVVSLSVALINIVLLPFVAGAISMVVSASYLGEELAPSVALRAALRRFWPLLGAWWLIHLMEWRSASDRSKECGDRGASCGRASFP